MDDIRVAAAMFNAPLGEIPSNLDRMEALIVKARNQGAHLICFPEMSLTGYCSDERIKAHAIEPSDSSLHRLRALADRESITILAGWAENDGKDTIYAAHGVFMPGKPMESYRKVHIAPPEKDIFTAGQAIPTFAMPGFRFGIQLCYDAHFPRLSTAMAEKGVDAVFIPHASPRGTPSSKFHSWMRHIPARAFDNGIFVIVCNQCGENKNGLTFPGLSFVLKPSGEMLSKNLSGDEGLLLADLKKEDLAHVRNHRMRYFLPNERKDLY